MKLDNYLFALSKNLLLKVSICIGILVVVILILLFTIRMDVVVEAQGKLIPTNYSIVYSHCEGTIITQNFVDNQKIQRGELLFVFDTVDVKREIKILENDIKIAEDKLFSQNNEIEEDLTLQNNNKQNSLIDFKNEVLNYKLMIPNYVTTINSNELLEIDIDKYSPMEIKNNIILQQKKNNIQKIKNTIANIDLSISKLLRKKQESLISKMEIGNLYSKMEYLKKEYGEKFIYADCDGIITSENSNSYHNRYFRVGEPLLQIHNPVWEVVVQIPEKNMSKVEENQKVDVQINSFNFLEYSSFKGVLTSISNKNNSIAGGDNMKSNYYEGRIRLDDTSIQRLRLKKDLSVNVRIITYNDIIINVLKKELLEMGNNLF